MFASFHRRIRCPSPKRSPVEIQITVKTADGRRMTSNIITDTVERALKTEEI